MIYLILNTEDGYIIGAVSAKTKRQLEIVLEDILEEYYEHENGKVNLTDKDAGCILGLSHNQDYEIKTDSRDSVTLIALDHREEPNDQ